MLQMRDLEELLKWARRANKVERFVKVKTARLILRSRRLRCQMIGCTDRAASTPCRRCGARAPIAA